MNYDENLTDDLQLPSVVDNGQSNRNSMFGGVSREMHRPVLSMPPIVLMGAPDPNTVTPSPIVEMPPSPAPNQMLIVDFACETLEGVLNIEDLLDESQAIIEGDDDDDDTDVEDLDDDCYFADGSIEVRRRSGRVDCSVFYT